MRALSILAGLLLTATLYGQSIVTPVFVHKDGEASASGYTGSEKDIYVDGSSQQSVGWVTFQTEGVDVSKIATAKLTLFVKTLTAPGTLGVYGLTMPVTAPENNVPLSLLKIGATALASVVISTSEVEKMLQFDITAAVKSGTFYGIALVSDDGLQATFDSKEGNTDPVILLTHNVENVAAKWMSGSTVPAAGLGKDGDYYLNTANGDVSAKTGGAWSVVTNIVGATGATGAKGDKGDKGDDGAQGLKGDKGDTGDKGETGTTGAVGAKGDAGTNGINGSDGAKGDKGDKGDQGIQGMQGATGSTGATGAKGDKGDQGVAGTNGTDGANGANGANGHSPKTTSTTSLIISATGSVSITLEDNRLAFGVGQRIRIASTATPANWMEGVITVYKASSGEASVARDNSAGSGTFTSWTVTVAGTFPTGTAKGDMQYWDGSKWVRVAVGGADQVLSRVGTDSIPVWRKRPMGTVMDIDGNRYLTVVIGNQEWTVENWRSTKLIDGTAIPNITDNAAWSTLPTPGYCWYNNDKAANEKYGALYNWYTVNTGLLAPVGWRVPSDADWTVLENYLIANGYNYDGTTTGNKIAKSMAAMVWATSATVGAIGNNLSTNNRSGFSALPGGYRGNNGTFNYQSIYGYRWSATAYDATHAWYRTLSYDDATLFRSYGYFYKSCGFSVRLVRDLN